MRKRTLLAVLVFGPALAHAQSSINIYGLYDAYAGSERSAGNGGASVVNSGGMNTSFWGIKGSESLGNGVSAVFALESFFRGDTGEAGRNATDALFSKNAYVGLAGAFGRLTVGRQTALFYIESGSFNPFGSSTVFSPVVLQLYRPFGAVYPSAPLAGDTAWSNAVRYSAPALHGLKADLMVQVPEGASNAPDRNRNRGLAATVSYPYHKLGTALGYQRLNLDLNVDGHVQEAANASVDYDFGVVKPFLQVYRIRDHFNAAVLDDRHDIAVAGATIPAGPGYVLAGYGRTDTTYERPGMGDARRSTWSLAYDYVLSRRTDVYAVVKRDIARRDALRMDDEVAAAGIRHLF